MTKTHWKKFHSPDYIGAYAFQPGETKILTISHASQEKVMGNSGKSDDCLVVHWQGSDEKPLIVNATNAKAIQAVAGSGYIEDWQGVAVELYTTEVSAFGATVDAVRVKKYPPRPRKPALDSSHPAYEKVAAAVADGYTRAQIEQKYTVSDAVWADLQDYNQEES